MWIVSVAGDPVDGSTPVTETTSPWTKEKVPPTKIENAGDVRSTSGWLK
jgi:hypothetical protein